MAGGFRLGKRERVDVAVIGGGPAGARAAARLAEHGLQVVLLERGGPDRLKPGAGGMPEPVFDRLGLGAEVAQEHTGAVILPAEVDVFGFGEEGVEEGSGGLRFRARAGAGCCQLED